MGERNSRAPSVGLRFYWDAIYLKLRPDDEPAEGVLRAWGITLEGRKVLLGLALGSRESYEDWLGFGRDLVARGMRAPALLVADGAPGISKAVRELWPPRSASAAPCTMPTRSLCRLGWLSPLVVGGCADLLSA